MTVLEVGGVPVRVATAGWRIPEEYRDEFPDWGDRTQLWGYSRVLGGVEINRTFRKLPRASTFEKWSDRVPGEFRFALKTPRAVTHDARLERAGEELDEFLERGRRLGDRLGPVLVQLPPSLEFDAAVAEGFLSRLRDRHGGPVAVEPRHEGWFAGSADALLADHGAARVAADPPRAETDGVPGGDRELAYFRLHGTPDTYRSPYRDGGGLEAWIERVRRAAGSAERVWLVFDNTAEGEGTGDALEALDRLS